MLHVVSPTLLPLRWKMIVLLHFQPLAYSQSFLDDKVLCVAVSAYSGLQPENEFLFGYGVRLSSVAREITCLLSSPPSALFGTIVAVAG